MLDNTRRQSTKTRVDWYIKNLDKGILVRPQFPLVDGEGVSMEVGGVLAQQPRFGLQDPVMNWVQGKMRSLTFSTMLYARHEEEGSFVDDLLHQFIDLSEPDTDLGRTPICHFAYGSAISETVLVESVNPVIKSVLFSGLPKEVSLSITLQRYVPFSQRQVDPNRTAKESFYLVASAAEQSYEAIARRAYGDPLAGDRLRKRHPESPLAPEVGSTVRVPSKSIILNEIVDPAFHALSLDDPDAVVAFENILADRNRRRIVVVK